MHRNYFGARTHLPPEHQYSFPPLPPGLQTLKPTPATSQPSKLTRFADALPVLTTTNAIAMAKTTVMLRIMMISFVKVAELLE
jgi:hypothetical protein